MPDDVPELERVCLYCGSGLTLAVLCAPAGFYLGYHCFDCPIPWRVSCMYPAADHAFDIYTQIQEYQRGKA